MPARAKSEALKKLEKRAAFNVRVKTAVEAYKAEQNLPKEQRKGHRYWAKDQGVGPSTVL
jgi:hypothetical protein